MKTQTGLVESIYFKLVNTFTLPVRQQWSYVNPVGAYFAYSDGFYTTWNVPEPAIYVSTLPLSGVNSRIFSAILFSRFSLKMFRFFCVFRVGKNALCSA